MTLYSESAVRATANEMFSQQQLDDMRAALDDPDVSQQNKQNFLYALSNAGRLSDDEIAKYAADVGADASDVKDGGQAPLENLANAGWSLSAARAEQVEAKVGDARNTLNQGGFSTSDEIVDEAAVVVKLFEEFHPRYTEASALVGAGRNGTQESQNYEPVSLDPGAATGDGAGGGPSAGYSHSGLDPQSIRQGLDEFRGVDFGAFHADAEMLSTAYDAVGGATEALNSAWKGNTGDWTGDAKAAAEQANQRLADGAGDLSQALRTAPDTITHSIDEGVQRNVINYAQRVLQIYGDGTVAELTPSQVDDLITTKKKLPSIIQEVEQKYQELQNRGFVDRLVDAALFFGPVLPTAVLGMTFAEEITEDNIGSELEKMKTALAEAETRLGEFCGMYQQKATEFHGHGQSFVAAISECYSTLIESLGEGLDPDPFAEQDAEGQGVQQPGAAAGGAPGAGVGSGGMPGGAGGSGSAPGGGAGSAGVPSAEDMMPDTEQATNPVTGEELEVNPETGEPYPIDPETGEAVKDAAEQEAFTVEKGDRTFEMTEPGEDGTMGISVADGSGDSKDYTLDFGTGGSPDGATAEGAAGEAEHFGPDGRTSGEAGEGEGPGGEKIHRPGPDGTIRIQEDGFELTAEQPQGPEGPTVVTVDDGQGDPTTYTLGAEDEDPTAGGQPSAGAGRGDAGARAEAGEAPPRNPTPDPGGEGGGAPDAAADGPGETDPGDRGVGRGGEASAADVPHAPQDSEAVSGGATASAADSGASAGPDPTTTTPQAVSGGGGGFPGDGGGSGEPATSSGAGLDDRSSPSGVGLGEAPGGGVEAGSSAAGGGSMGGMGMMGGMGAGGAGGQDGDQERSSSAYRIEGDIFEALNTGIRISGTIGDTGDVTIKFGR